jgi:hypothetical protein
MTGRQRAAATAISEQKALQLAIEALDTQAQEMAFDHNVYKQYGGGVAMKRRHDRYRELKAAAEFFKQRLESHWAAE